VWSVCGALALAVLTPRLRRRDGGRGGFPAYAAATPAAVLGWLAAGAGDEVAAAGYLVWLSRLAVAKYRLVQAATVAAAAALALTAGAVL